MIFILACSYIDGQCVECKNGDAGAVCTKCGVGYFYYQEYGECRSKYQNVIASVGIIIAFI